MMPGIVETIKEMINLMAEGYYSFVCKSGLSNDVKHNGEIYSTIWNGKYNNNRPLASWTYIVKVLAERLVNTIKITIIKL